MTKNKSFSESFSKSLCLLNYNIIIIFQKPKKHHSSTPATPCSSLTSATNAPIPLEKTVKCLPFLKSSLNFDTTSCPLNSPFILNC